MNGSDRSNPFLPESSRAAWAAYAWGLRFLRWLIAFPLATVAVALIAIGAQGPGAQSSPREAFLAFASIGLLGAGLSTWLYRSGPFRHPSDGGALRNDMPGRLSLALRLALKGAVYVALFIAQAILWAIPLMILDSLAGRKQPTTIELLAYVLWCGICAWLTMQYLVRKMPERIGSGSSGSTAAMPIPSPPTESGLGGGLADRFIQTFTKATPSAPSNVRSERSSAIETSMSVSPKPVTTQPRISVDPTWDDTRVSDFRPETMQSRDGQDLAEDIHPLGRQILNELDDLQRRAIWLLQHHQSVTVGELAGALDLRTARVSGFMNGLNRQLAALGCQCFRTETLPSGEQQYVFIPQETDP